MIKYPIVIFSYNRPTHLENLLISLKNNSDISDHKIFLFCDGPKNDKDKEKIRLIKNIIYNSKLKFFKISFNEKNQGLSKNIINGVSEVLNTHKACMVFEDDLVLDNTTIKYLNFFLNFDYKRMKLGSVSAYSYINKLNIREDFDYYISLRHCSWGWGTWSSVWNEIDWENIDYKKHFEDKNSLLRFSRGGKDLNLLLWGQYKNIINSWAIRFNLYCSSNNLLSLHSRYSLVENCGADNSGTHEKYNWLKINLKKNNKNYFSFKPESFDETKIIRSKIIDKYIKFSHKKSVRLIIYYYLSKYLFSFFKKI